MIKNRFLFLLGLCFVAVMSSCKDTIEEPTRIMDLYVVDKEGLPVEGAKVEVFFTEDNFRNSPDAALIEPLYTDENGLIVLVLDIEEESYYVNIEKEEANNWHTESNIILFDSLRNADTIMVVNNFLNTLVGRNKKRWIQTEYAINGNPNVPSCGNQWYHDFSYEGVVRKFMSDQCPDEGRPMGVDVWEFDEENELLIFGLANFKEPYKIIESSPTNIHLRYRTEDGVITIDEKFRLVQ